MEFTVSICIIFNKSNIASVLKEFILPVKLPKHQESMELT